MSGLIAKKLGMSRLFLESGEAVAVTYLGVEPNTIVRTKTEERDGYNAVVLGVGASQWKTRKGKERTRYSVQKEWQVESLEGLEPGKTLTADAIPAESTVTVSGTSKGKGFQGVIKRHKFSRGPETHGSHHHRRPGSVGMKEWPGRVLKGKKMPGHMGGDTITLRNRSVVVCDPDQGVLGVKGPVPGPNGTEVFLTIETLGEVVAPAVEEKVEEKQEEAPKEEAPVEKALAPEKPETEAPAAAEAPTEKKKEEDKKEEPKEEKTEEKPEDTSDSKEAT